MKKIRSFILLFLLGLVVTGVNAQSLKFGVKAGLNAATLSGFDDLTNVMNELSSDAYSTKSRLGFHAGVVAQLDLPANLFLQPELLYSLQGIKGEINGESETDDLGYLQLPIYLGYKINVGMGLDVILGVGPYLGYGLHGTDDAFDETFKRFDFGLSAMGGIQFNKLQITIGYDLGLTDNVDFAGWETIKDLADLSSISNRNFKVSLAYFF